MPTRNQEASRILRLLCVASFDSWRTSAGRSPSISATPSREFARKHPIFATRSSKRYSEDKMRPLSSLSLVLILVLGLCAAAAPQKHDEYFTENEIDLIRDAQELQLRV